MLVLYQVGGIPLYTTLGEVEIEQEISWRNPTTQFAGVGGQYTFAAVNRPLLDEISFDVKGRIFPSPSFTSEQFHTILSSYGGRRDIPIIAFRMAESDTPVQKLSVDWLINYGIINEVPNKSVYGNADNPHGFYSQEVDFNITLFRPWKALDPWLWEHRSFKNRFLNPYSSLNQPTTFTSAQFKHPKYFNQIKPWHYFYLWNSDLSDLNPNYWGSRYAGDIEGGVGSDFAVTTAMEFYSDPSVWSADPHSIYAFTGCQQTGSITIEVSRSLGEHSSQVQIQETSLNLTQLSTDLVAEGLDPVQESDIIYTGLTSPFPGFIKRNGAVLSVARPRWSYPGRYPGETSTGYSQIRFIGDGTDFQVAYLHEFGLI